MDMRKIRTSRMHQAVFASLVAALVVGGFSTSAYADAWTAGEGFEYQPATTWQLYHSANGSGGFDINAGTARTGTNAAWLSVQTGWSSVGKTVHITPAQLYRPSCAAQIYVKPFPMATLNFEIIDPGTWTYVQLKTVTLTGNSYQAVTSASFTPLHPDVFVRVSLLDSGNASVKTVYVDDLLVFCQYY